MLWDGDYQHPKKRSAGEPRGCVLPTPLCTIATLTHESLGLEPNIAIVPLKPCRGDWLQTNPYPCDLGSSDYAYPPQYTLASGHDGNLWYEQETEPKIHPCSIHEVHHSEC